MLRSRGHGAHLAGNRRRDFTLKGEHVLQVALMAVCPGLTVGVAIVQLRRNPYTITRPQH